LEVIKVKKKILGIAVFLLAVAMLATPVMAIGPINAEGKNRHVVIHGFNTQMWLPSSVMNEWIENPMLPGPIKVTVKDAAKFQIKDVYVIDSTDFAVVGQIFLIENQWVKLSQGAFATMLIMLGFSPTGADGYPDGIYIKLVYVGFGVADLPPL
jgi:hypothetical protein